MPAHPHACTSARLPALVDQEGGSAEDIEVVQIVVGTGSNHRPIARGSHYAMTASNVNSASDSFTQVAIIDLETQVNGSTAHTPRDRSRSPTLQML